LSVHTVLLISYHFHPTNEIGGRRTTALARHLAARGLRVIVVSAFGQQEVRAGAEILPGIIAIPVKQPRRLLLDSLFESDGQALSSLCEALPVMTRFGVMKHLAVLVEAGLVTTRRSGREKLHFLNPVPIGLIADRWISKYAQPFTRAMVGLRAGLEPTP